MKTIKLSISLLLGVILFVACGTTATPTAGQVTPAISTTMLTELQTTPSPVKYDEVTLKITISQHISYAPIFIAQAEGYFKEYGINLEYVNFNNSAEAIALLVSGDTDIYAGTINTGLLNVINMQNNVKAVSDRGHIEPGGCTYQALLVRKDLYDSGKITSAADLAGQPISSSTTGPAGYLLSTYLAQAGLTFKDVDLKNIPNSGEVDAFANKTLAANLVPEPDLTVLLNAGNAVVLAGAENVLGNYQFAVIAFNQNLLQNNRDAGARFLAGYLKGVQQYSQGKTARNLQILTDATGESIDMLQKMCWVPIRGDGTIDFAGIEGFQQWSVAQDQLDNAVTEKQFWDPSFIASAQALIKP
jgi:NitT/TauT family transport system substrate-binding protein